MKWCLRVLIAALVLCGHPALEVDARPEARKGSCTAEIWVIGSKARAGARVELVRWSDGPAHPHGFYWMAGAVRLDLRLPPTSAPIATTRADDAGRASFDGLAAGEYVVGAVGEDGSWGGSIVPFEIDGQHQLTRIRLSEGPHRVEGRLRYASGRPFQGSVLVSRHRLPQGVLKSPHPFSVKTTTPAGDGSFVVDGMPDQRVYITALVPGRYRRFITRHVLPQARKLDLIVDHPAHTFRGRLIDIETRMPIAGAKVTWQGHWNRGNTMAGVDTTANDGWFELPASEGLYAMWFEAKGYASQRVSMEHIVTGDTWPMRRGRKITGRATRADTDEPLPGLRIGRDAPRSGSYQRANAFSGADGMFTLSDQAPGGTKIYAHGGPWIPAGAEPEGPFARFHDFPRVHPLFWHLSPRADLHVEIPMIRGATLRGRVLTHVGDPVAGISIIDEEHSDPRFGWTGQDPPPMAVTDAEGRFVVEGLIPGTLYEPEARAPFRGKAAKEVRIPWAGTDPDEVVLRLPSVFWVDVQVIDDETREPLVDAEVSPDDDRRVWHTDERGIVRVGPLQAGTKKLQAWTPGYASATQDAVSTGASAGVHTTIALSRLKTIEGTMRMPDGTAPRGAVVFAAKRKHARTDWSRFSTKEGVDAGGTFRLELWDEGTYHVRGLAWKDGVRYAAIVEASTGADDVVLTLAPAPEPTKPATADPDPFAEMRRKKEIANALPADAALVIYVQDPDGRPVPRATVRIEDVDSFAVHAGRAVLKKPWPADKALHVSEARAEDGMLLSVGPLTVPRPPSHEGELTLTLPREHVIRGRFVGPDGEPAPRVWIEAHPSSRGSTPADWRYHDRGDDVVWTMSDAKGDFRIGSLAAEEQTLRLRMPAGWLAPTTPLRLTPGDELQTVKLRRSTAITVTVVDHNDRPLEGVGVSAERGTWTYFWRRGWSFENRRVSESITDEDGRAVLHEIDPDMRQRVEIDGQEGPPELHGGTIEQDRPEDIRFVMKSVRRFAARVRFVEGFERDGFIEYLWRVPGGKWQRNSTALEGDRIEVSVETLEPIEIAVAHGVMDRPIDPSTVARVDPSTEEVTLVARPAGRRTVVLDGFTKSEDLPPSIQIRRMGDEQALWSHVYVEDGRVQLDGLDPDATYLLWGVGLGGGKCVRAEGIRAGEEPLHLTLEQGLSISGALESPSDVLESWIYAHPVGGGPVVMGNVYEGRYSFQGLTPGRWMLRIRGVCGDVSVSGTAEVEAGTTFDLEVKP